MTTNYKYLFGPVPSRRLGRSLGVDLTPHKTCSFDCIFCQLGRTTNRTVTRQDYVPTSAVIAELHDWVETDGSADYITLAGSGEPTLHSSFGEVIDAVKSVTTLPVALLTNGSLLGDSDVRTAAARADVVKVSLSAWDPFSFDHVNRPHPDVTLKGIYEGTWMLREALHGELWIEVFIAWGVNSIPRDVGRIAELIKPLKPDKIQLNTAVRPPAETFVEASPEEHLVSLAKLFEPTAEVIADFASSASPQVAANEKSILAMLSRRPCTADQMASAFGLHRNELSKYLGRLVRTEQVAAQSEQENSYYVAQEKDTQHARA
ncbi:MAG: radical SAM protein [Verrucomicrobia bacterium]|jgi:wyosine [tRNA(Phe)-imidazoG37] synthetase (radical SAM superfamily)|nr:radical SAM protein [Verrucomicrobiota bacterium]MBT7068188.1 radical SAM protein [Verrucomicrobiota bacterium]MBT7701868.1 radical SAM protein [Verrucomicrobiota bacterium]